jgi:Zn-dependent metalloprotease
VKLEDHGCCKLYSVEWEHIVNGVTLPDSRLAQVDPATGNVFSFSDQRVASGPVPSPKIARDEAIRLATVASGLTTPKLEDAHLMLTGTSSPVWGGRLVWSVQLSDDSQGYVSAAWVYVDAVTGETVITGRG